MRTKESLKRQAIKLRKSGKTYSEILKEVPVAKSTISLWFREVSLSKSQKQRITKRRIEAGKRGGIARRKQRLNAIKSIKKIASKEVGNISNRELWLIGIALYWAEGSKEKINGKSSGVDFGNSDPEMIRLYLKWLLDIVQVAKDQITFSLYIHESAKHRIKEVKRQWSLATGFPEKTISYIYYKKHKPKTVRKNIEENYVGLLSVRVKRSTNLNRKIMVWVDGILENIR